MENKFTHGPWFVEIEDGHPVVMGQENVSKTSRLMIGFDICSGFDQCIEDAYLCAAAPDMYNALELVKYSFNHPSDQTARERARNAMSKALLKAKRG